MEDSAAAFDEDVPGFPGCKHWAIAVKLFRFLLVPDPARVEGRRVVVYDHVMTTGETLNAIARALRQAGALEVSGIVLARQPW